MPEPEVSGGGARALAAPPLLCYAPAQEIPHQPHVWYGPPLDLSPDTVLGVQPWYCDGWADVLPMFTRLRSPTRDTES